MSPAKRTCHAVLLTSGSPVGCPTKPLPRKPYCSAHLGPLKASGPEEMPETLDEWREIATDAIRNRANAPAGDEAHDPQLVRALLPLTTPLYSWYWRAEVFGVENIPTEGPGLLVANHSGTIPIDGGMLKAAVLREHGRNPWLLAADLAFTIPGFRTFLRLAGNARADRDETLDLMRQGELLAVFPEGYKGIGKGWQKRYQLQRFGRGGFVEMCMETGAPIIPVAIIGGEEAYPMIGNLAFVARKFKLPYFPVTPTWPLLGPLGAVPLPSKWIIAFGEPIPMIGYGAKAIKDQQLVLEMTEQVRQAVQNLIAETLPRRKRAFL